MDGAKTILVVEDDADCRTVLGDLLELAGYRVAACGEATSALEVARRATPSLAIVDLNMPGRDGAWLVRAMAGAGAPLSGVPIILSTGAPDAREVADRLGVRVVEKPFEPDRLLALVGSLLRVPAAASP